MPGACCSRHRLMGCVGVETRFLSSVFLYVLVGFSEVVGGCVRVYAAHTHTLLGILDVSPGLGQRDRPMESLEEFKWTENGLSAN